MKMSISVIDFDSFRCETSGSCLGVWTIMSHSSPVFVVSSEYDDQKYRVRAIHALVHKLPEKNRTLLDLLTNHLYKYVHTNTCSSSLNTVWS